MAYWVLKVLLTPVLHLVFRIRVEGRKNIPRYGPVILASNHQSFVDSIFLPMAVHRRVTFVAKAEYFESWKTAWFFRAVGMIPLKRDGGTASERALASAREVLNAGGVLGIYPEGTRSKDGRLYKGHTGVARLAIQCGAAVVPVAQFGTAEVQPIGMMVPKLLRRVRIVIGTPLRFPAAPQRDSGHSIGYAIGEPGDLRRYTDEIMTAIAAISGQEYVPAYANRDRGLLAAPGSEADPIPRDVPEPTGA